MRYLKLNSFRVDDVLKHMLFDDGLVNAII